MATKILNNTSDIKVYPGIVKSDFSTLPNFNGWGSSILNTLVGTVNNVSWGGTIYQGCKSVSRLQFTWPSGVDNCSKLVLKIPFDGQCKPYGMGAYLSTANIAYTNVTDSDWIGPSTALINNSIASCTNVYSNAECTSTFKADTWYNNSYYPEKDAYFEFTNISNSNVTPGKTYYIYVIQYRSGNCSFYGTNAETLTFTYTEPQTTYTVNLTAGTGISSVSPANGTYLANTTVSISATVNTGYEFDEWVGTNTGTHYSSNNPYSLVVDGNKYLTANAFPKSYKNTIHHVKWYNGAEISREQTYFYGTYNQTINNLSNHLKIYQGFTNSGIAYFYDRYDLPDIPISTGSFIQPAGEVVFDFLYYPNTYTVTYNANGGYGSMSSSIATYEQQFITNQCTFSRDGYKFIGWNEAADGSGVWWYLDSNGVYESGNSWTWTYINDITLYAQWEEEETPSTPTFKIYYYPGEGTGTVFYDIVNVGEPAILSTGGDFKKSVIITYDLQGGTIGGDGFIFQRVDLPVAIWELQSSPYPWYNTGQEVTFPNAANTEVELKAVWYSGFTILPSFDIVPPSNKEFLYWELRFPSGETTIYNPGEEIQLQDDTTLYAVYKNTQLPIEFNEENIILKVMFKDTSYMDEYQEITSLYFNETKIY